MAEIGIFDSRNKRGDSERILRDVLIKAARRTVKQLREAAPVSTGRSGPLRRGELENNPSNTKHLKNTIKFSVKGGVITIFSEAPHANAIAFGHPGASITGNPWLVFPTDFFKRGFKQGKKQGRGRQIKGSAGLVQFATKKTLVHKGHKADPEFKRAVKSTSDIISEELRKLTR